VTSASPVVNVHTHFQPESVLPLVEPYGITMRSTPEGAWYFRSGNVEYSIPGSSEKFWGRGLGGQLVDMDAAGVDVHVLSASPMIFGYHLPADVGVAFSQAFNDETARSIAQYPDRFWGSAQLPMQDLAAAAEELERAVTELGFRSCTVGFVLGAARTLADPECDAFLATAERLNVPILLHPVALGQDLDLEAGRGSWLRKYQMDWAWGYLFVETIAVVGFVLGGALDRHPNLRVMIPHGGGMIPFQRGRLDFQAKVFGSGNGGKLDRAPSEYLSHFYFDTVVHEQRALEFLVEAVGIDNVVLGSNYPGWDNLPIWDTVRGLPSLNDDAKEKILGRNAVERLFCIEDR
jgi:aminocarboxymuconate-semialdehyde decarboxylase